MTIKVLIVDDHELFREGLVNLFSKSSKIEIVAQAKNGKDAIIKAKKYNPNIVLMDIGMPIMNGIEATVELQKKQPEIKVIALSIHADKHYTKKILEAGAYGYLFKDCNYQQVVGAIEMVYNGIKCFSDEVSQILIHNYLGKDDDEENTELTTREFELLKLFAEGKTRSEIADMLFISVKTVGTHKQHILKKLELKNTTDIVKYAIRKKIIFLE
ncbi:MAG: DNA-binding response regulator [Rhodobacteraceae bacterium]|nr:MAG: DNA-binding response regulator [Paracoccaceae bacterium]